MADGLLSRFCCSGTDVSAKTLAVYADPRTPSVEPHRLACGFSQSDVYQYSVWTPDKRCLEDRLTLEQAEEYCMDTKDFLRKK